MCSNVVAYGQKPLQVRGKFGLVFEELARHVLVQLVSGDREAARSDPTLRVSVERLEAASLRLVLHNFEWLEAARGITCGIFRLEAEVQRFWESY